MIDDIATSRAVAEQARVAYRSGHITRAQAVKDIQPFLDLANEKSRELAKQYGQRARLLHLTSFLR